MLFKMCFILVLIASISILFWAIDSEGAIRFLKEQGHSKIEILGYGWLSCSPEDIFSTRFTAINSNKKQVKGTVCRGLFKNSTIRWE